MALPPVGSSTTPVTSPASNSSIDPSQLSADDQNTLDQMTQMMMQMGMGAIFQMSGMAQQNAAQAKTFASEENPPDY